MITAERSEEFTVIHQAVRRWAASDDGIVGVLLVGSWARGAARMDSDADVVVLGDVDRFVEGEQWIDQVCGAGATLARTMSWGVLTERRVRLPSGFEIEFGFVPPLWAKNDPVDPGTHRVVSDGCEIWHDPTGLLERLFASCSE